MGSFGILRPSIGVPLHWKLAVSAVQQYQQQITEYKGHMQTIYSSSAPRVLLAALALATIEIPAKAAITYVNDSLQQTTLSTSGRMTTTDVADWSTQLLHVPGFPGLGLANI